MLKQIALVVAATALIAGCSSPVKLDDKAAGNTSATTGNGMNGNGIDPNGVKPIVTDPVGTAQGPVGVARLVYFDYDGYSVKPEFQQMLEAHSRFLKADPRRHVALEGHTDERGGSEYNLALGQKRAEAVRRALSLLGVADGQMEAVSFGEEKPADPGHNEAAWAQNRRVEITYR